MKIETSDHVLENYIIKNVCSNAIEYLTTSRIPSRGNHRSGIRDLYVSALYLSCLILA